MNTPAYRQTNKASLKRFSLIGLIIASLFITLGVAFVMQLQGRPMIFAESSLRIEQIGNNVVESLNTRAKEIAALTRSVASAFESLPKEDSIVKNTIPHIVDFQKDFSVAGGGVWPEPYAFDGKTIRYSFFWGRDENNNFAYYDDYNDPNGAGYHNEEWYVPARYQEPGDCYWSQSYMDPYSYQPMVTCTVGVYDQKAFNGNATIDLKLEGLQEFMDERQKLTGGYIFLVDRNNKFITFPARDEVIIKSQDDQGNISQEFMTSQEFSDKNEQFKPIAMVLEEMSQDVIEQAKMVDSRHFEQLADNIDKGSYQIDAPQAQMIAATLINPLQTQKETYLYKKTTLENDFLLNKKATLYLFHIPDSYWKLVIVKPIDEEIAIASSITQSLLLYTVMIALLVVFLAYIALNRIVIRPLTALATGMEKVIQLVHNRNFDEISKHTPQVRTQNEIGLITNIFATLTNEVGNSYSQLQEMNQNLEQKVAQRTKDLTIAFNKLKASQLALVQSEKMASLGQMVSGLAHEMNTPLGYLRGNVEVAQDLIQKIEQIINTTEELLVALTSEEPDEEFISNQLALVEQKFNKLKNANIFEMINQNTEDTLHGIDQLSELVVNMRNFARMDQAKLAHIDIHTCIQGAMTIARNVIKTLEVKTEFQELPLVRCAPAQINQVILNILTNAAQAVDPQQGKILVKTGQEGKFIKISIQDNGCGIPKDKINKIFDPFFTTKTVGEGTGLGLSISYQIIKDHSGTIKVNSVEGKGTVFHILLPIEE